MNLPGRSEALILTVQEENTMQIPRRQDSALKSSSDGRRALMRKEAFAMQSAAEEVFTSFAR